MSKNNIPKLQLIIGYKEFFNSEVPANRLELLDGMCKLNVITELAGLNYRLKPKTSLTRDTSLNTQIKELKYFCGQQDSLFYKYSKVPSRYTQNKDSYPLIFTRQACLFGLEEVLSSELEVIPDFNMSKGDSWEKLLKYMLAVSSTVTSIAKSEEENIDFENLNPKLLPLNELCVETDPLFTPYRGYKLFEYLINYSSLNNHVIEYLLSEYNMNYREFIFNISSLYFSNIQEREIFDFFFHTTDFENILFENLSRNFITKEPHKILRVKKFPIFKVNGNDYILTDNVMLLQKSYSQFINDFWFDYLKPNNITNISSFKSTIGYFFENYTKEIIDFYFSKSKHIVIKLFDELKFKIGKNLIELTDIYIRSNSKIILGEVKSTSIYDSERYGGDIDVLYKNNRDEFFKSFGVNQIVEAIKKLNETGKIVDLHFPENKVFSIFPIIIVNEVSLQTPLMSDVFNSRFNELMTGFSVNKIHVYPLSIVHISDLERMQIKIHDSPECIFDLFKAHCKNSKMMPPFYITLNRLKITSAYKIPMDFLKSLISDFSVPKYEMKDD